MSAGGDEVRYLLLGPVAVTGPTGPVRLGGPKQRAVLASLLLRANQVVSDDQLVRLVWGKQTPANARGQLQIYVSGLRKLLGRSTIVRRPPGYLIEVAPGELDLAVFSATVDQAVGDLAAGLTERASERLRTALALWRGPALGGAPESIVEREGPSLEEQRLAAFEHFFDAELAMGRAAQLAGDLHRLVREHPYRERLCWQLMLALHRTGRTSEALAAYTDIRLRLATELGIDPGSRLQELHQRILRGDDCAELVARPGGAAPEPATASGTTAPDATSTSTTAPGEEVRPAELPHDVRGFVGRERELATLSQPGDESIPDIWVISGMAGVGKTALAVHWAHLARDRFPDAQLYVDLRGFDADHPPLTPAAALSQLLRALGTDPRRIPAEVDAQARLYRSVLAGQRVLLVLDNARGADQVRPLLPGGGPATVLVTSRDRLGDLVARDGARALALGVLPAADAHDLLADVLGAHRVAAEPEATRELARRCGQLPLALRIAAANISANPNTSIAAGLAELVADGLLAGLAVDGAATSSVAAALMVSYESLPTDLRRLFRRLGLFPGCEFTAHTAAALDNTTVAEANRRLRTLAAANLLEQHAAHTYRFHDLVRLFAAARAIDEDTGTDRDIARERLFAAPPAPACSSGA